MSKPIERLHARAEEVATVVQFKDVGRNKFVAVAVDGEVKEYDAMTFVCQVDPGEPI